MKSGMARGLYCAAVSAALVMVAPVDASAAASDVGPSGAAIETPVQPISVRERLTGDWGGARTRLEEAGVTLNLNTTADIAANVAGGLRRANGFAGLIRLGAELDLSRIAGWTGGSFHVGGFLIGGHGLGDARTGALGPMSNIQADPAGRLADVYLKQKLLDGRLVIRLGQIAAEGEFVAADTSATFVNATFDWPVLNGVVLPGGGPAYPVPTPGVHVSFKPDDTWTLQAAALNGNPMGDRGQNRHGLTFPLNTGVLLVAEVARRHTIGDGLPGVIKIGAWYNSGRFSDVRLSANGLPLDHPDAAEPARRYRGNYAIYGLVDQTLWRATAGERSLSAFARFMVAPMSRRSYVDFYADTGVAMAGVFAGRPQDVAGIGVAYASISQHARRHELDLPVFSGVQNPARSSELLVEASYQAKLAPWLKLQPFAQLIIRPGGGDIDPGRPSRRIRDAVVIGLRSFAEF